MKGPTLQTKCRLREGLRATRASRRIAFAALAMTLLCGFEWDGRVARLQREYASGDVQRRIVAVRQMADYSAPLVEDALLRALEDPEDAVRMEAARATGRAGVRAAVPVLADWLEDPDELVRSAAATALGELGDPRPLPLLVRALGDLSADVRIAAIDAIVRLGGEDGTVPMLGRLDDPDSRVRIATARALGRLGDPRAVVPLIGRAR
ncbi:MAG: HEAT repeat domain-containing protein, partial [Myxococcota bacterium]